MLTTPITTPYFHSRVLTLLSSHLSNLENQFNENIPVPTIPSLSPADTTLAPSDIVSQLLAFVSPWIDLSSPDPVIYNLSRQVLELEVAYAAFCGIGNVILPSPRLHHGKLHGDGITQYAYAISEALNIGAYLQFSISLPMMDIPEEEDDNDDRSLAVRARRSYMGLPVHEYEDTFAEELGEGKGGIPGGSRPSSHLGKFDFFGTWDAWNVIRTVCKYNSRLFVGKNWTPCSLTFSPYL